MSTLVEQKPRDCETLRLVSYFLQQKKLFSSVEGLLQRILLLRPFEVQSYRDLARFYIFSKQYIKAVLYYEMALNIRGEQLFSGLHHILMREYLEFLNSLMHIDKYARKLKPFFKANRLKLNHFIRPLSKPFDFRNDIVVTLSWNTNNSDVDLWVEEPGGVKCGYRTPSTINGGVLIADITNGYGPERYFMKRAKSGVYNIRAQYYSRVANRFSSKSFAYVTVVYNAGSKHQRVEHFYTLLKTNRQEIEIAKVVWPNK